MAIQKAWLQKPTGARGTKTACSPISLQKPFFHYVTFSPLLSIHGIEIRRGCGRAKSMSLPAISS